MAVAASLAAAFLVSLATGREKWNCIFELPRWEPAAGATVVHLAAWTWFDPGDGEPSAASQGFFWRVNGTTVASNESSVGTPVDIGLDSESAELSRIAPRVGDFVTDDLTVQQETGPLARDVWGYVRSLMRGGWTLKSQRVCVYDRRGVRDAVYQLAVVEDEDDRGEIVYFRAERQLSHLGQYLDYVKNVTWNGTLHGTLRPVLLAFYRQTHEFCVREAFRASGVDILATWRVDEKYDYLAKHGRCVLACMVRALAFPPPEIRWYRETGETHEELDSDETETAEGVLSTAVTSHGRGDTYRCEARHPSLERPLREFVFERDRTAETADDVAAPVKIGLALAGGMLFGAALRWCLDSARFRSRGRYLRM